MNRQAATQSGRGSAAKQDLDVVFAELRKILKPYAAKLEITVDTPSALSVDTHHVMKSKKPLFFGAVHARKSHVSFHLMPVYVDPALLRDASTALRKRMAGKSCFNFAAVDRVLFKELAALTKAGFARYKAEGFVD